MHVYLSVNTKLFYKRYTAYPLSPYINSTCFNKFHQYKLYMWM